MILEYEYSSARSSGSKTRAKIVQLEMTKIELGLTACRVQQWKCNKNPQFLGGRREWCITGGRCLKAFHRKGLGCSEKRTWPEFDINVILCSVFHKLRGLRGVR